MKGSPDKREFWAKLQKDDSGEIIDWHSLLAHSADVAAMMEMLLRRTILTNRISALIKWDTLTDVHIARLSAMAALHDAGKANHGFQNRAFNGVRPQAGHLSPIVELLESDGKYQDEYLIPLGIAEMIPWFSGQQLLVHFLLATWGHHGRPVKPEHNFKATLWKPTDVRDPGKLLKELGDSIQVWFPDAFQGHADPFPADPVFQHAYNGLLTLADWLGSDHKFFPFADYSEDYIETARENADSVVDKLKLNPANARKQLGNVPVGFDRISDWEPFEIQKHCLDLPIYKNGSLTILESDTGSGKTESAIARFTRLYQAGLVDGMYFAVPTRSAATQLYERVEKAVTRAFADVNNRPPVVQAVSGYIKVDAVEGTPLPHFNVLWPENKRDILRERGWAAEHPKRYLAGAIVVGTIDQVLLSTLQVNHAHMRTAALLRHFLVVDEVHSSDAYMSKLLDRVLDVHLAAGGHALLMSATLGTATRYHLAFKSADKIPEPREAQQISYPLITHVDAQRNEPETIHAASSGYQKVVQAEVNSIAEDTNEIAQMAANFAEAGARVLVIRNLVKDCIKTQQALEEILGAESEVLFQVNEVPAPHHSRFAPEDRKRLDQQIEQYFGKQSGHTSKVAVATQTVEQSLDIDADLLITDLCPMDVLLQRIGRLHRHKRQRPEEFETARCVVLTPQNRDLSTAIDHEGRGSKGTHGLGTVYQDLRVLEATWEILEDNQWEAWQIPEHNRVLVERSTHPEILKDIVQQAGEEWDSHQQYITGQAFADRQIPELVGIDFHKPFAKEGFAEELTAVKTRLGRDDYQIFLPEKLDGPFGDQVEELTITEWQIDEVPDEHQLSPEAVNVFDGGFSFVYYGKRFTYDRFGLSMESNQ